MNASRTLRPRLARALLPLLAAALLGGAGCEADPAGGPSPMGGDRDAGSAMPTDAGAVMDSGAPSGGEPGVDAGRTAMSAAPDAGWTPECDYDDSNVCAGNSGLWCGSGRCVPCAENTFNCDGTRGCECQDGCEGMACLPQNDCVGGVVGECGSDDRWCYTGHPSGTPQCRECTDGFLNCDGVDGCEVTCASGAPCVCP